MVATVAVLRVTVHSASALTGTNWAVTERARSIVALQLTKSPQSGPSAQRSKAKPGAATARTLTTVP